MNLLRSGLELNLKVFPFFQKKDFEVNGTQIVLRQPRKEDLEKEYRVFDLTSSIQSKTPSTPNYFISCSSEEVYGAELVGQGLL